MELLPGKRILKSLAPILFMLFLLIALVWFLVTRPFPVMHEERTEAIPISAQKIHQHIRFLAETIGERSFASPIKLQRTADYLVEQLQGTGAKIQRQTVEVDKTHLFENILAEYGPASSDVIIVGAHYDTADNTPGSDDNASGVAVLLEIGRALASTRLKGKVLLACYTLEEQPFSGSEFMGSAVHARSLKEAGVSVRLMIALEMLGYYSDESDSQDYPSPILHAVYPNQGNFVAVVGNLGFDNEAASLKRTLNRTTVVPARSINAPGRLIGIDRSDHRSFWAAGYKAVMVTDTANFRNHNYHKQSDVADSIDFERVAEVAYGVFQHVIQLDDSRP